MQRIVVNDELAEKLMRFPQQVRLCDENNNVIRIIERVAERPETEIREAELSEKEILQTLREIFVGS